MPAVERDRRPWCVLTEVVSRCRLLRPDKPMQTNFSTAARSMEGCDEVAPKHVFWCQRALPDRYYRSIVGIVLLFWASEAMNSAN
jgi:hypothetical protein